MGITPNYFSFHKNTKNTGYLKPLIQRKSYIFQTTISIMEIAEIKLLIIYILLIFTLGLLVYVTIKGI